jgi:hypothetical protein
MLLARCIARHHRLPASLESMCFARCNRSLCVLWGTTPESVRIKTTRLYNHNKEATAKGDIENQKTHSNDNDNHIS